jgi:hypothetical protein
MRRGIQFGDEVTPQEKANNRTDPAHTRGLLFVCYQSNLSQGFSFMQKCKWMSSSETPGLISVVWANNPGFKPLAAGVPGQVGFDPIIGQNRNGQITASVGLGNPGAVTTFGRMVISRGGEYFFTPSLSTLANKFAA